MKYCQHCGGEIHEEAVICIHCGCEVKPLKQKSNSGLLTVAKVFMIISCAACPGVGLLYALIGMLAAESVAAIGIGLLMLFIFCIPLAWCLPMTIVVNKKIKNDEPIGVGLKVCTLLFVNTIAGILLLCYNDDN